MSILVVAAHPDDEVLGMGGTIARHVEAGESVRVLFLGHGVGSRGSVDAQEVEARKAAAHRACGILGADILKFEAFPDNAFDSVPLLELVQAVERAKAEVRPRLIYTHHGGDLNVDHRLACQAVLTAFRPQPQERYLEIRAFETGSATEWSHQTLSAPFLPDTYIDISTHLERLLEAYRAYRSEIRPDPHARSVEALEGTARYRGRQVGMDTAEAFVTLRRIIRIEENHA